MRKIQFVLLILFTLLFWGCTDKTWVKFSYNPIMPSGPAGTWNNYKTDPTVLRDGGFLKMWYGASEDGSETSVAYAESYDGINWGNAPWPALETGPPGSWDEDYAECPTVLIDPDASPEKRYKMWYCGMASSEEIYRIGYATSPDGINWTKYENNPVLDVGDGFYDWDYLAVADPMVLYTGDGYMMWYTGAGFDTTGLPVFYLRIGLALSQDGINWVKYPGNPVLDIGPPGSFEDRGVAAPSVLWNGEYLEMYYGGWSELGAGIMPKTDIGYAVSFDGMAWVKSENNPILENGKPGDWDSDMVLAPSVLIDENQHKMWFTGQVISPTEIKIGIGYAIESD